jgi:hypothetical protein
MSREPAIQVDTYLERLLSGGPAPIELDLDDEPRLGDVAHMLRARLVRFHPSFRFEERLAERLRREALGSTPQGELIPFAAGDDQRDRRGRHLLVGGAIASGVSIASLAGAAVVAWRRIRSERRWERLA